MNSRPQDDFRLQLNSRPQLMQLKLYEVKKSTNAFMQATTLGNTVYSRMLDNHDQKHVAQQIVQDLLFNSRHPQRNSYEISAANSLISLFNTRQYQA
jgi:hypothetical protein